MINMDFKSWYLNEVGTSSSCVAVFSRPIFGADMVSRDWPQLITDDEESPKKKKKKKKKKT